MKVRITLIAILLLSLFLRLYQLGSIPVSLFGDEIDAGYQAWSLATTLRDYHGHFLPVYVQSLSEWRAPLEMYLAAPFIALLGPSTFSARLSSALLGVLSIYLVYLIVNLLTKKKSLGLAAAVLLALTPWHLHYTRNLVEQPALFTLILAGVYFYLRAKDKPLFYPLSLFFFILTFYTYSIANLATPIICLLLLFCFPPKIKTLLQPRTLLPLILVALTVIPIAYQILFGHAAGRFKLINIANDRAVIDQVILDRNRPWLSSPLLERIFSNKITAISGAFINNYFTALSPQFLFLSGDPIYRQSVDHYGVFLVVLAPFFLVGLVRLGKDIKNKTNLFLLLWLFLIPIGSSLTQGGGNHASRLFLQNFPVIVIIAAGLDFLLSFIKSKYRLFAAVVIGLFILVNFSAYWYRYTSHYAFESSHVWQYGYEPLFFKSRDFVANAQRVFINNTSDPALYRFAFYYPVKPADFLKEFKTDVPQDNLLPGFDGFRFGDKYYFGTARTLDGISKLLQPGDIYFASQKTEIPGDWDLEKSPPKGIKVLLTVRDFYGLPLFYVLAR